VARLAEKEEADDTDEILEDSPDQTEE
jgi:hypothetical protein